MKRLALVLAALALLAVPGRSAAQTIPVRPGGGMSSLLGLPFDMPVTADLTARTERLGSFALRVSWNPDVLRLQDGMSGSFGGITVNGDSIAQGIVRVAGANPAGASGLVDLLVGRFEPVRADTTTVRLEMTEFFAAGTFADLLASVSVSNGLYCPARGRFGDIDRDANVNSRDALIALSNAVGLDVSAFDITLGDVDSSGTTNARDALVILSSAVGLPMSGFRVLALAAGSCAAGPAAALVLLPGAVGDVLPGQVIKFAALAREASGALQAAVGVSWRTSNPAILTLLSTGEAVARDTGTATITAIRDSRDTARVTVHVTGRRTTHYVSADAATAQNQIGTAELPFGRIKDAGEMVARPGDTIVLRPGRYEDPVRFGIPIVLLGQTVGGRPAVITGDGSYEAAITVDNAVQVEVRNITLDGVALGIHATNGATVVADSVTLRMRPGVCGMSGGIVGEGAQAVIVRRSHLTGEGQWDGCSPGVVGYNTDLVLVEDAVIGDFGDNGIGGYNADSVVVRRTTVHDNGYFGVGVHPAYYISAPPGETPGSRSAAAWTGSSAVVVEDSRLLRNYYPAVYVEAIRTGRVSGSVIEMLDYDGAIYAKGTPDGHGYLELTGDSLSLAPKTYYGWIDASGLDSVRVDGVRVVGSNGGYVYDVGRTRATNSSFRLEGYNTALEVGASGSVNTALDVDSVHVVGLATCTKCVTGVYTWGTTVNVNRFRGENLDEGIDVYDSSLTVTNSVISNAYYGIYASAWSSPMPQLARIQNVTMTDVHYGILTENIVTVIDAAAFTRGWGSITAWDGGDDTVRTSTFTDVDGPYIETSPGYVADNTFLRPPGSGMWLMGSSLDPLSRFTVLRNVITCDTWGASNAEGIGIMYADAVVNDNTVSGCSGGILADAASLVRSAEVRGNTVAIPPQASYPGIRMQGAFRATVAGNTVTGGAAYGVASIHVGNDSYYRAPWVRADSNVVSSPVTYGILANEVDTLQMFGNLVEDFTSGTLSYVAKGAISLFGNLRGPTLIQGNTIRRSHGSGIAIDQVIDTVTIVVDSNAISGSDTAAVSVVNGHVHIARNNIRDNAGNGVYVATTYDGWVHRVVGNAFQGNALYAVYVGGWDAVDATGNWWGADGVPPIPAGFGADSVFGSVADTLPLGAEPSGLPVLAPPALLARAFASPAVQAAASAVPAAEQRPAVERPVRAARPVREQAAKPERGRPRPAGVATFATPRAPERSVSIRTAAEELRARRDAARAERDSTRAAERDRRHAERRATP